MLKSTLILLSIFVFSLTKAQTTFVYIDGNNNKYEITETSIKYTAVKKKDSSSGEYDGGKDKSITIGEKQWGRLKVMLANLEKDTANHLKNREMGCGTLEKEGTTFYINMNSLTKKSLEDYLKKALA